MMIMTRPQLSPAMILMSGGVHEGGMIQSWLFTSRNQNLVSGKLWRSGFWSYSKFVKWNRVKMAKNGLKMAEIFWGASHMINNSIFNNFSFSTFSLRYFTDPSVTRQRVHSQTENRNKIKPTRSKSTTEHNFKNLIADQHASPPTSGADLEFPRRSRIKCST